MLFDKTKFYLFFGALILFNLSFVIDKYYMQFLIIGQTLLIIYAIYDGLKGGHKNGDL